MKHFRFSLTFSILSSLACLLVLTWILLSLISFKTAANDLFAQKNEEARLLLAAFAATIPVPLRELEEDSPAALFASRLTREKDFDGITVVDGSGKPVFTIADGRGSDPALGETLKTGREMSFFSRDGKRVFSYAPIYHGRNLIGAARLTFSLGAENERLQGSRHLFLAYFVLDFLLLLGFGSFMLSRIVVVPIRKLLAATKRIAAGDYGHTVHVPGSAEIAELAESFNLMAEGLERKRTEVEATVSSLERANSELQLAREETLRSEKMASVGLLAAGMAHEIGTPLSAIIGYAGILSDELIDDPVKSDYLHRIEVESGRIDRIVRGLLDYARPSGSFAEKVDVAVLLHETVDLLSGQGVLKQISLSVHADADLPLVFVDPHQLQQVLINLCINARDAMPAGGELLIKAAVAKAEKSFDQVTTSAGIPVVGRRKDDFKGAFHATIQKRSGVACWLTVSVVDSGEGISTENLGRIFDPFFTTKEPGKGTGLGLAISARIVDSFGGRIIAESGPGKGTAMTVWLPVKTVDS